jgi:probable HAF family extracellular repeat protein
MKSILLVSISTVSLMVALAAPAELAAQAQNPAPVLYTVTDLGTLGGTSSVGYGINHAGVVVGAAAIPNGNQHAFIWYRRNITDLGTLGGANSIGINEPNSSGEVPIISEISTADPLEENFCNFGTGLICLGATWQAGVMTPLPTLGGNNAMAYALNNSRQVAGVAENGRQDPSCPAPQVLDFEAVIWGPNPGHMQELPSLPGDTVGFALGINDFGEAVGSSGSCANTPLLLPSGPHAVLWKHGFPINLGNLGGSVFSTAASINDFEEVIGASILPDNQTVHSFLWTRETGMQDIGTLPGDVMSLGGFINNLGQVVGWSCNSGGNCRAYIWQNGFMRDLNALVPPTSPLYLVYPYGINDAGEIVGQAIQKSTGDFHAFLLTPVRHQDSGANSALNGGEAAPSSITLPDATREELQQKLHGRFAARTFGLRNMGSGECFPTGPCSCTVQP